jgi:hypothetical protein
MAGRPATPAQVDDDTPIPHRYGRSQKLLTEKLLALPTFAERLVYLLDKESDFYTVDGAVVVDAAIVDTQPDGLTRHSASAAFIAKWVEQHGKTNFSRGAMSQLRTGRRPPPRPAITNALAEFWRIDPLLLDPTIPAERFADSGAADETDIPPSALTGVTGRTWELMNRIGFQSVQPREISNVFETATAEQRLALLDVLEGIAKHHPGAHSRDQN